MANTDKDIFGLDDFDAETNFDDFQFDDDAFENLTDPKFDIRDASNDSGDSNSSVGSFNMDLDDIDEGYPQQPNDNVDKKKVIKTSLIAIGAGLLIIVIGFTINRAMKNSAVEVTEGTSQEVVNTVPIQQEQLPNVPITSDTNWVEFNGALDISSSVDIESSFTVTDIEHFALIANDKSDKQVKSIVTGNISGLVGTYELEVDFGIAQTLSVGAVFKVTYKLANNNGYNVISSINY